MTKQEVIKGLKCHSGTNGCNECPYDYMSAASCVQYLALDALNLLNGQDNGIEPKISKEEDSYIWYYCGRCGYEIDPAYENYCPTCGTKIKGE